MPRTVPRPLVDWCKTHQDAWMKMRMPAWAALVEAVAVVIDEERQKHAVTVGSHSFCEECYRERPATGGPT